MKREGRQHGMVRTYPILPSPSLSQRPEPKYINNFNSPPTAGLFTKVSTKPTNHSKFTGKCGKPKCSSCHVHPACKSKSKTKGTQKLRSTDKSISWQAWNSVPGLKFFGLSATGLLAQLAIDDKVDNFDDVDGAVYDGSCNLIYYPEIVELDVYDGHDHDHDVVVDDDVYEGSCNLIYPEMVELGAYDGHDHHDDDNMSFCDVGLVWKQVDGDEDWCMVEEM